MRRQYLEEAMDQPGLDPVLLAEDLHNLEVLNHFFGGARIIRQYLMPILRSADRGRELVVVDVGSGAGDLCRLIIRLARGCGQPVRLISVDRHPQIQRYARERSGGDYPEIRYLQCDAVQLALVDDCADVCLCTLALHHLREEDAARALAEMRRVTRDWAVVADLRRGRLAYWAVWLVTRFTRNPLTRRDGPVSVKRAFSTEELRALAKRAGWTGARLRVEPWFRMSLVERKQWTR